ncbi:MAG: chloride channel protein [Bacteroidetes bacterium]|nr:chloride channel protein [Bacteroidota bacterium]
MANKRIKNVFRRLSQTEHLYIIILSIIIGTVAGFAAVGVRLLIHSITMLSFPGNGSLLDNMTALPWYLKVLIPAIGALIVGPMIYKFAPEAKGHGVPEVMASLIQKGGRIRPRVAIVKAIASSITIGTGGSVGREGPIIQIGASIGSTIGQILNLSTRRTKTLLGCGAAAGIAAAFNAPIAGILFSLELLLMDFSADKLIPVALSSVISTTISRNIEGNFAAFSVPQYSLLSSYELIFYLILGLLSGIVSFLFIKALYFSEDLFDDRLKMPVYLKPVIGGLLLGTLAIFYPHVLGMGYDSINLALQGKIVIAFSLILIFAKILATSVTLGSGSSGGIFAPSLFMGAMLGSMFGGIVHNIYPEITAGPGAYALVAMAGLVAGTTRAPITAIIIVFEMTSDYHIILPLVIVCVISTYISAKFSRESIYTLKLVLRNINIKEGTENNLLESLSVRSVLKTDAESVTNSQSVEDILDRTTRSNNPVLPVTDDNGTLLGILTLPDILQLFRNKEYLNELVIAGDIMNTDVVPLTLDDNCFTAVERMRDYDIEGIPVVNNDMMNKFEGMVWGGDVHAQYLREMERIDLVSKLASSVSMKETESQVTFHAGYVVADIEVPRSFVGKKIIELNIRKNLGVEILAVKTTLNGKESFVAFPGSDYVFSENDRINIAGLSRNVNKIKNDSV